MKDSWARFSEHFTRSFAQLLDKRLFIKSIEIDYKTSYN